MELKQEDLFGIACWLNSCNFVQSLLNLALIGVLILGRCVVINVFSSKNTFFELVGVHCNAVRDPVALRSHAGAGIRDVNVIGQAQLANHTVQLLVKIDLFEDRTTITKVKQRLVELRCVLFHHRRNLVVHKILNTGRLLRLVNRFLAQNLRSYRPTRGHQLLHGLRLELDNGFCEHWVRRTCCTTERFCSFLNLQAKKVQTFSVHLLPVLPRGLVCLENLAKLRRDQAQNVGVNNVC